MGFSGISVWQLLIVFLIILVLFGTKRLKTLGSDMGAMLKGFRDAAKELESPIDETDKGEGK